MQGTVIGISIATILLAGLLVALFVFTPTPRKPGYVEGRPLLEQTGRLFTDSQVELQFAPPLDWAMQERTVQSPNMRKSERTIVKYKQFIPGSPVAWLKVSIADSPEGQSPADYLRKRKTAGSELENHQRNRRRINGAEMDKPAERESHWRAI